MKNEGEKYLSYILRHKPERAGLKLDSGGWVDVTELCVATNLTKLYLDKVVTESEKKRFEYNSNGTKIRACQGHSIPVDLGLTAECPPFKLYHGTILNNLESIQTKGLIKGSRNFVHLSADDEVAQQVGARRGKPIILTIQAKAMYNDKYAFYKATNGVWLTDHVPWKYIIFYT